MGTIKRPDIGIFTDVDSPIDEAVEIIKTPMRTMPVEDEPKPMAVVSSTAFGQQFGVWKPVLLSPGSIEIYVRSANYVKLSQLVTCTFDIVITGMIGGDSDSKIILGGLPNISLTTGYTSGSVDISYYNDLGNEVSSISGTVNSNSTSASLWCQHRSERSLKPLTRNDVNLNTVLVGTVTYISNS